MTLANRSPRVTIFSLDCCDVLMKNIKEYVDRKTMATAVKTLPKNSRFVEIGELNTSKAALNVYIFHGAASCTEAKETITSGESSGSFTTAFIKWMVEENQSLDELSAEIRTEMTNEATEESVVSEEVQKFRRETYNYGRGGNGIPTNTPVNQSQRSNVQVSPTENYLQHEFRGWCFYESAPICFGKMPPEAENLIRTVVYTDCWATSTRHRAGTEDLRESSNKFVKEQLSQRAARNAPRTTASMDSRRNASTEAQAGGVELQPVHEDRRNTIANKDHSWKMYTDDKGREYYYNTVTKKSQWTCPAELSTVTPNVLSQLSIQEGDEEDLGLQI